MSKKFCKEINKAKHKWWHKLFGEIWVYKSEWIESKDGKRYLYKVIIEDCCFCDYERKELKIKETLR